jgi:hypothetical protein
MVTVFGKTNEVTSMRASGSKTWHMGKGLITGVTAISMKASGNRT